MTSLQVTETPPATPPEAAGAAPLPRARAQRRGSWAARISVTGWRLIALVVFLILWHLASIPAGKLLLPSPIDIAPAFIDVLRSGQLLNATLASLSVFI